MFTLHAVQRFVRRNRDVRVCGSRPNFIYTPPHWYIGCMNLWKKQLNYINIGAAGNKKFEPGLLSESNIIGLLCGRSGKSSFSGAPALCRERLRNVGSDRNRYTLDSHTRELKIPIFSGSTQRMHFSCPRASWYFHKRANYLCSLLPRAAEQRSERRRSCTFQRAAISLGKVATPARSLALPPGHGSHFSPSLTYTRPTDPVSEGAHPVCALGSINKVLSHSLSRGMADRFSAAALGRVLSCSLCAPHAEIYGGEPVQRKSATKERCGERMEICARWKIPFVEISDAVWRLNGKERFLRGKAPWNGDVMSSAPIVMYAKHLNCYFQFFASNVLLNVRKKQERKETAI